MHFGFALELPDIFLWNIDFLDIHLDLLYTDIASKYFVCLHDAFKACLQDMYSRRLQDMYSRRLQDMSSTRLQDVFKTSSRPTNIDWVSRNNEI